MIAEFIPSEDGTGGSNDDDDDDERGGNEEIDGNK